MDAYRHLIKLSFILLMLLAGCQAAGSDPLPQPTPTGGHYFNQTGYPVQGLFWQFYQRYGGSESLGYPLSNEMIVDGWRVQYFTKGRLEFHPENEPAYRITVGWVGDLLGRRRPPIPTAAIPPATDPARRYYPETGHTISGDFLRYFEAHGGTVRFGRPISEPFLLNGRLTQDFQSARFFWRPQHQSPVGLEEIGRLHLQLIQTQKNRPE